MTIPLYQVDAFARGPFTGNPAAVCLLEGAADEGWMQSFAAEMNLSETAYLHPGEEGFALRWFTPAAEVDLCGHATLASAHVLWEAGILPPEETARFHTKSGLLTARRQGAWIELDFPTRPPEPVTAPQPLMQALGLPTAYVGRSEHNHLVELDSEAAVRALRPDFGILRAAGICLIATSRSEDPAFDFVSRYFAPPLGIDEDPVTGSAHCTLGPFWTERLTKSELLAFQASSRGGVVRVAVEGARTRLGGQAVTVFEGTIRG